jgi:polar amino acid transport system substrate-binding protein
MESTRTRSGSPRAYAIRFWRDGPRRHYGRGGWSASVLGILSLLSLAPIIAAANDEESPTSSKPVEGQSTWIVEVNESTPLAFPDEDGDWIGFEIDRLNLVAKACGRRIEYRPLTNSSNRFRALSDDQADIVLGGNTITSQREARSIDFTYPTFDSGLAIAVPWSPGKESGSRLMAVAYAYAHWELLPLGLAAFVLGCIFFRQLKRPEVNSILRGSLAMIALITIIIMVHADVTTRLRDRDEIIAKITGPQDLMGVGVATKRNTTTSVLLPTLGVRLHLTDTIEQALKQMRDDDDVEAVVFDSPVLWHHAVNGKYGRLRIVGGQFERQKYGMAVREDDQELLEMINRHLLRQDEQGTTEKIRKLYFGNYR